ncbi:MAG: Veg family protein [Ruminococcus sp.]|nr:Veg family protein [Ruminococcus sp.]
MNPYYIKEEIKKNLNREVIITVYGLRNRKCIYEGNIKGIYPNIFTISNGDAEKSFSYADVITGDIKIKYK